MRTLVVDQNLFNIQAGSLREQLASANDLRVIIPDVALVEMCKGPQWHLSMQIALAQLQGFENRAVLSASVYDALNDELSTGIPVTAADLVPADIQSVFQDLLRSNSEGTWMQEGDVLRERVASIQSEVEREMLDPVQARINTAALVQTWHKGLPRGVMGAVASSKVDPEFVKAFIQSEAYALCVKIARERLSMTPDQILQFVSQKPMVLRYLLAYVRHSLLIARHGASSIEETAAWKELNNRLDIEYALIATYFDGLMSKDRRALAAYQDLRQMLDTPLAQARKIRDGCLRDLGLLSSV